MICIYWEVTSPWVIKAMGATKVFEGAFPKDISVPRGMALSTVRVMLL